MDSKSKALGLLGALLILAACAQSYRVKPVPFKAPGAYPNATEVGGAAVAARAYVEKGEAKEAFGFDIRGAGMLPVQVIFDNRGPHTLEINPAQTFLEDKEGNLWPVLSRDLAYERATRYKKTEQIFKKGTYSGFLGATAGAIIGAAIGIVTGQNVASAAGKGAAVGGAAGFTLGGAEGYGSNEARRTVISDLRRKSLENRSIAPKTLAYGFIFFPGEAKSAGSLRLQLRETGTDRVHVVELRF